MGGIAHCARRGRGLHMGGGSRLRRYKTLRTSAEAAILQRRHRIAQRLKAAGLLRHRRRNRHPRIRRRNGAGDRSAHGITACEGLLIRRGAIKNARLYGIGRLHRRIRLLHRHSKKAGGRGGGGLLGRPGKIRAHDALLLEKGILPQRRALLHPVSGRGRIFHTISVHIPSPDDSDEFLSAIG